MAAVFPRTGALVVVKIGGSLMNARHFLDAVLADIRSAACRSVIVPGGGAFADGVRAAQAGLGFGDRLAHRLALKAMDDFACVLAELYPFTVRVTAHYEIAAAHLAGRLPVWSPLALLNGHPDIEESWRVTSDSIAASLAASLEAEGLILVKSADGPDIAGAPHLAERGLVDAAFGEFTARLGCPIRLVGPAAQDHLADLLADPHRRIGTQVTPQAGGSP